MHRKRIRGLWAQWAETKLEHAAERVAQWRMSTPDGSDGSSAREEAHHASEAGRRWIFAQLKDRFLSEDWGAERVAQWVETHGEEAWVAFVSRWERVSREIVDDMLDDSRHAKRVRADDPTSHMGAWDRAARIVTERIVEAMMEPADNTTRQTQRDEYHARSEIHEYTG